MGLAQSFPDPNPGPNARNAEVTTLLVWQKAVGNKLINLESNTPRAKVLMAEQFANRL